MNKNTEYCSISKNMEYLGKMFWFFSTIFMFCGAYEYFRIYKIAGAIMFVLAVMGYIIYNSIDLGGK